MLDVLFLSPYSFETGSFNELEAKLAARRFSNVLFSTLDNAGLKAHVWPHSVFHTSAGDLNAEAHTSPENALTY